MTHFQRKENFPPLLGRLAAGPFRLRVQQLVDGSGLANPSDLRHGIGSG